MHAVIFRDFLETHCTLQSIQCFSCNFLVKFSDSCGCSMTKFKTPLCETLFHPLNSTEHGSPPSLTTRDRKLVTVLEESSSEFEPETSDSPVHH